MQTSYIFRTGGKMLLMALLLAVCAISVGFCGSRMGAGIARDLRRDIFAKVTSFTNNEYDKFGTASLITRSTNDVTQVQGLVTMGLRIMCYAPIIGIGGTIMALSKSVSMAWAHRAGRSAHSGPHLHDLRHRHAPLQDHGSSWWIS